MKLTTHLFLIALGVAAWGLPQHALATEPHYPLGGWYTDNFLYRCSPAGNPTLCYLAATEVEPGGGYFSAGSCHLGVAFFGFNLAVTVKGDMLVGPGSLEYLSLDKFQTKPMPNDCLHNGVYVQYTGSKSPCAQGGVGVWYHQAEHLVDWSASAEYQNFWKDVDVISTRTFPLPVGMCDCPDEPQLP